MKSFAGLLMLVVVSGCALTPSQPPMSELPAMQPALARFALEGRLQVRDGERSAAVGVDWQHRESADEWLFTGPLGQGLARIEANPQGARMTLADGRRSEAASPVELAHSVLGVEAPFAQLPRWITARPDASAQVRQVDAYGRVRQLVDQGWVVDYLDYIDDSPTALPRKVDIHRGDTRLRVIVDAWN